MLKEIHSITRAVFHLNGSFIGLSSGNDQIDAICGSWALPLFTRTFPNTGRADLYKTILRKLLPCEHSLTMNWFYHAWGIHDSITERMGKVSAHTIDSPVGGSEIGNVGTSHCQMLNITPIQTGIDLKNQSYNSGSQGCTCTGSRVRWCTNVMEIGCHDFPFTRWTWAIRGGQGRRASFGIPVKRFNFNDCEYLIEPFMRLPWNEAILCGGAHGQGPNRVRVTIAVAIILVSSTVSTCPHKNRAFATPTFRNPLEKSLRS